MFVFINLVLENTCVYEVALNIKKEKGEILYNVLIKCSLIIRKYKKIFIDTTYMIVPQFHIIYFSHKKYIVTFTHLHAMEIILSDSGKA